MFSQNIMIYVCVLCFSVNDGLFTFAMMSMISYWLLIDDVIAVGEDYSPIFSWAQLSTVGQIGGSGGNRNSPNSWVVLGTPNIF